MTYSRKVLREYFWHTGKNDEPPGISRSRVILASHAALATLAPRLTRRSLRSRRGQPAARSATLRACESCSRCVSPRSCSTRKQRGGKLVVVARSGSPRSPPLAYRVARPSSPRAPCARGNFLASAVCRVRCARRRFVSAVPPARRPCPLSPPPVPPPLRSLRSLPGGGCNAPSLFLAPLRSLGGRWLCAPAPPRAIPRLSVAQGRPRPARLAPLRNPPAKRSLLGWPLRARPRPSSMLQALKISAL